MVDKNNLKKEKTNLKKIAPRKDQPKEIQDKLKEQYPGGGHPPLAFTQKQIDIIEEKAANLNQKQIADYFLMNDRVFRRIKERQPEVEAAYQRGRAKIIEKMASACIERALGGSDSLLMFWLKTQARWSERTELDITTDEESLNNPRPLLLRFVDNKYNEK